MLETDPTWMTETLLLMGFTVILKVIITFYMKKSNIVEIKIVLREREFKLGLSYLAR